MIKELPPDGRIKRCENMLSYGLPPGMRLVVALALAEMHKENRNLLAVERVFREAMTIVTEAKRGMDRTLEK